MNIKNGTRDIFNKDRMIFWLMVSSAINILCIILIKKYLGISFYSTDDTAMMAIVAGDYNGVPNPRMMFIKYPIGVVLSLLYVFFPNMSWYSITFIGVIFISMTLLLARVLWISYKSNKLYLGVVIFLISYIHIYLFNITLQQFTLVSALVSSSALYWFLTIDYSNINKKVVYEIIITNILFYFALCIRIKVVYMFIPFMLIFSILSIYKNKHKIKAFIIFFTILFSGIVSIQAIEFVAYNNNTYESYKEFSHSRSQIYDYYGKPNYEENIEFYNSLGIDENIYESIDKYNLILDEAINSDNMKIISEKAKSINGNDMNFNKIIGTIYNSYTNNNYFKYSCIITLFLIVIAAIFAIINKKYDLFIFCILSLIGGIIGSIYFVVIGRFPSRIADVIIIIINIIAIHTLISLYDKSKVNNKILFGLILLPIILVKTQFLNVNNVVQNNKEDISKREIFENYCFTNSDNFYFHDTINLIPNYKKLTLRRYNRVENFSVVGGWASPSPYREIQYSKWEIDNFTDSLVYKDNVFFLSKEYPLYIKNYMEDKYGQSIKVEVIDYIQYLNIPVYKFSFEEADNYKQIEINEEKLHNLILNKDINGHSLEVTGIDPYINDITANETSDGIKFDIISEKDDLIDIYYKVNGIYSEENKISIGLKKGENKICIRKNNSVEDIRIDFSNSPEIIISGIEGYQE